VPYAQHAPSRRLARKNHCADAVWANDATTFTEGPGQLALVERNVMGRIAQLMWTVDHDLSVLGNGGLAE
jgi:hypothetical protein